MAASWFFHSRPGSFIVLNVTGGIYDTVATSYVSSPTSGAIPTDSVIALSQEGGLGAYRGVVPSAANAEEWMACVYESATPNVTDRIVAVVSKGNYAAQTPPTTPLTADTIAQYRTFIADIEGNQASNIVTLNTWSSGTITLAADFARALNPDTTIDTVDTVTVTKTDATTVATSNLAKQANQQAANFDVAAIAAAGTFTVRVDVTTVDGQALSLTGTLIVE